MVYLCHFFATCFYGLGLLEKENSWIYSYGLTERIIYEKYLYSFYFTLTTMVTVGYGDFTPKTIYEVLYVII
jgi:hypothetical protein